MAGYYTDHYRQALTEVPHQEDEDATERQMRSISYVTLSGGLPLLMDRDDRLSMAHGLELRVRSPTTGSWNTCTTRRGG